MDNFIEWADEKYGYERILKIESDKVILKDKTEISIDVFNLEKQKKAKLEQNKVRAKLLIDGTLTADKKLWFNYETAQMFISAFVTLDDDEELLWRDANSEVVTLTYDEAKSYMKEIRATLQIVYGLRN